MLGAAALAGEAGQDRQAERERLARAGLRAAEDVGAGEGVRDDGELDGVGTVMSICASAMTTDSVRPRSAKVMPVAGVAGRAPALSCWGACVGRAGRDKVFLRTGT